MATPRPRRLSGDPAWLASRPVLIFDLGGVVLDWNPRHLYRKLIPDEVAREWFLTEVCSPAWNLQMDPGKPAAEAVAELSARFPGPGRPDQRLLGSLAGNAWRSHSGHERARYRIGQIGT